jgi:DNA-binding response OmpR family regulator
VDDVVRKPIHVRKILARIRAIRGRAKGQSEGSLVGELRVFSGGRDPEVAGEVLPLPRRERRILEYLVSNRAAGSPRRRSSTTSTACSARISTKT